MTAPAGGLAPAVAELAWRVTGRPLAVGVRAYDGSRAGPDGEPRVEIGSPAALRRMFWNPGELGVADAYVAGDLRVHGDLVELLRVLRGSSAGPGPFGRLGRFRWPVVAGVARLAGAAGVLGGRPAMPAGRARVGGRRHSRARDLAVVAHHYDLSNEFYELLLDPAMCYSCAYWTSQDAGYGLPGAQRDKLDLVCGKLGLEPGMRLLDVGCGWGSLVHHAAVHYGVRVTGVTLSARQAEYARRRTAFLGERAEIRLIDYRDVGDGPYDAVSVIEMGEHVGAAQYPAFAAQLSGLLRPGARLLIQQMSRGSGAADGGAFIASYIAPDMHMRPLPQTLSLLEAAGLEVTSVLGMREHYVRTFGAWRSSAAPPEWTRSSPRAGRLAYECPPCPRSRGCSAGQAP